MLCTLCLLLGDSSAVVSRLLAASCVNVHLSSCSRMLHASRIVNFRKYDVVGPSLRGWR